MGGYGSMGSYGGYGAGGYSSYGLGMNRMGVQGNQPNGDPNQ